MTWEEIEKAIQEEEQKIHTFIIRINAGENTFSHKRNEQEGILHPCTVNDYKWQFSFFDSKGPIGDIRRNTIEEIARSIYEYGYEFCEPNKLVILH